MKFKFKNTLLVSFLAIAGILGVSSALINKQVNQEPVAEKAEAATTDVNNIYLKMIDENTKYTAYGRDPKVHIWNVTISSDCSLSKADAITTAGGTTSDSGVNGHFSMTHISGGDNENKVWYVEFPWYITGFDYQYYNIKPTYTDDKKDIEAPYSATDYIWGSFDWNNPPDKMNCSYTGSSSHTKSTTTYTLSFNSNGGSSVSSQTLKEYQKTVKPSSNPTKTNYTFSRWTETNSSSASEYTFGSNITSDKILFGQWRGVESTVTLSATDADNDYTKSVTAAYQSDMPSISVLPTRSGYSFEGYYTSGGVQYYDSEGESVKVYDLTTAVTLYARWKAIRVITKYVVKDGVKEVDAVGTDNVIDGNTYAVPSSPGDRSGFSFVGWYTDEACGTSYTARAITSNIDLYAKYEPNNFAAKRHYLSLDSNYGNWEKDKAWFAVYLVAPNDTSAIWIRLTKMGTSHFYYFDIPSESYNELVFVRMNPATNTPSFDYDGDNCWNQTSDIYKDGNKDYWLMNSNQGGDHDLGASGVWYTTTDNNYRMFEDQLDPTPSSMRYWFTFKSGGGSSSGQFFKDSARLGIHAYHSSTGEDHYYLMTPYQNSKTGDKHYFYYVDIPITVDCLQLVRVSRGSTSSGRILIWNFPEGSISVSDYLPSKYWLIDFSFSSSTAVFDLTANADKPGGSYWTVSAWAMSEVLKAYYTCSDSELNGYGAAANLKSNFWDHKYMYNGDFDAATATNNPWVYDYTYADYMAHGGSYTGCTRSNSYGMNCTNKWNAISTAESRYSLGAWSSVAIFNLMGGENNFSTIIIITSSSIALLSVTALSIFVIKKRKTKEQ